tara:strand:+ start:622 stop:1071 length:450 start_codon:yes stop_codon:yes gene_type:complete
MVEINHHYNEYDAEKWSQLILWDWSYGRPLFNHKNKKFHVQKWVMMKDAYDKTKQGEKKYLKIREEVADTIKDHMARANFINNTHYIGDFVGGKYYPFKNHKTGYWVITCHDGEVFRRIQAKIFRETHTRHDPELLDREEFNSKYRRGW